MPSRLHHWVRFFVSGSPEVRESAELVSLGRYQRRLLFGGGAVLSLVAALIGVACAWALVKDYIAEGRSVFQTREALLLVEIETKRAALQRDVINAEMLWGERRDPRSGVLDDFVADGGRATVRDSNKVAPQLALGVLSSADTTQRFAKYLALTEQQAYVNSVTEQQRARPATGYYYSPDLKFAAIFPAPRVTDPAAEFGVSNTAALIARLAHPIGDLTSPAYLRQLRATRGVIWIAPVVDPLTGVETIRLAQPAFDGNSPFLVFVSNFPVSILRGRLDSSGFDGEFAILDDTGHAVLDTTHAASFDPTIIRRFVASGAWRAGQHALAQSYRDGVFAVSDRLANTGWVLSYAYSWRTIVVALASQFVALGLMLLVALIAIWVFVWVIDRRIFMPAFRRSKRVFESESLNRTIIGAVPVGLSLIAESNGEVMVENDVMRAYERHIDGAPLRVRFLDAYHASIPKGAARSALLEHELECTLDDGGEIHLLASVIPTRYAGRDVLLCTFSDITRRKESERKLEEARAAADSANSAKSTFLALMSHEIRTPLNAIMGNLELLARVPLLEDEANRLRIINAASDALLNVINDILDFSRVQSGQFELEYVAFDLVQTLGDTVAIFRPLAQMKEIELVLTVSSQAAGRYRGDPTRIRQIVSNLLGNALKFTEQGRVAVDVAVVGATDERVDVSISVTDTGIGIDADAMGRIFDAYSQADSSIQRRFGGTGLGLPLCRQLATLMGGSIEVESRMGEGATFTVTLPLAFPAIDDASAVSGSQGAIRDDGFDESAALCVLAVEDHPVSRLLLLDQFDELGIDADVVASGREAVKALLEREYDLVLTDLSMPDMDGYALAACLKDQGLGVPVVGVTAHVTLAEHERGLASGMTEIVLKPLSLTSLRETIRRHVARPGRPSVAVRPAYRPAITAQVRDVLRAACGESLDRIRQAVDARAVAVVLEQIHSMKGAFASVGILEGASACEALEREIGEGGLDAVSTCWPAFEARVRQLIEVCQSIPDRGPHKS
jgi:two-component system, NarL family, capsular synthesis sensor histidine kinase RcsC